MSIPHARVSRGLPLALALAALLATAPDAAAQQGDFRWHKALPAGQRVRISNVNGNVTVQPASGGEVEIVGVRHGGGGEDAVRAEVVETSDGIIVCALKGDMRCDEDGAHGNSRGDRWDEGQMDFQVRLP